MVQICVSINGKKSGQVSINRALVLEKDLKYIPRTGEFCVLERGPSHNMYLKVTEVCYFNVDKDDDVVRVNLTTIYVNRDDLEEITYFLMGKGWKILS